MPKTLDWLQLTEALVKKKMTNDLVVISVLSIIAISSGILPVCRVTSSVYFSSVDLFNAITSHTLDIWPSGDSKRKQYSTNGFIRNRTHNLDV